MPDHGASTKSMTFQSARKDDRATAPETRGVEPSVIEAVPGLLALEDGSIYAGRSLAAQGEWVGEVVFVTGMTGYQETITDPSYWGQMVVFTCPHIGNVGVNAEGRSRQAYCAAPQQLAGTAGAARCVARGGSPGAGQHRYATAHLEAA